MLKRRLVFLSWAAVVMFALFARAANNPPSASSNSYSVNEDTTLTVSAPGVLSNDSDPEGAPLTAILVSTTTNGVLNLNSNGSFTYRANTNYNGTDHFTYKANDGTNDSSVTTVTITISAVNDAPVANPDDYVTDEDITFSVAAPGVLGNDVDPEGNSMTAILVTSTGHGTLTFTSNGSFTYRANTNYNGLDSFTYKTRDSSKTSAPVTVTITIDPVNDAPRATNDSFTVNADIPFTANAPGVLANDGDVDGDTLTPVLVSNPTHGTLALNTDGSFIYTPATSYVGSDSFSYRADDGVTTSAVATVSLTIVPAPIVVSSPPANQIACLGDTATFSVTATGTALTYQWFKGTNTLAGKTNNTLVLNNVIAADAATYRVRLTGATNSITNSATLTVNVPVAATPLTNFIRGIGTIAIFGTTPSGSGPFAYSWLHNGSTISGQTSSSLTLSNLATGDSGTYSVIVSGACGSVTNSATLTVSPCFLSLDVMLVIDRSGSMVGQPYTDARTACTNFIRNLHLMGSADDAAGLVSFNPVATLNQTLTNKVSVLEQAVNNLGPATNGTCISCGLVTGQSELASSRHRLQALPIMVLLSDGVPHDFDTPSNALYNATQIKNAGTRIFTVGLGSGVDPVLMSSMASSTNDYFFATNSSELGALFDAISTVICRPPTNIFGPSDAVVCAGADVTFDVIASGCSSFNYQWRKDGAPLTGQTNNAITLTNVVGADSGVYSVVVMGSCRTVTNSAVLTVNEPALIVTPPVSQTSYVGSNALFSVSATGTSLSYQWLFNESVVGTGNTLALNNLTTNDAGSYCVVVGSAECGGPVTNCAVLTIQNRAPLTLDDSYATAEDTTLTIAAAGVLVNDADPDGDVIGALLVSGPIHGTLNLGANGAFSYTPSLNYTGVDSFTYRATDGRLDSELATVTITISPMNDAPVAINDFYTTPEDTTLTIPASGVLANDSDVDADPLSTVLVSSPSRGTLSLSADGSFSYTPSLNYTGVDTFTYRAADGALASGVATVTITIVPGNDAPVAANDTYSTAEDTTLVIAAPGLLANDSDVDGDPLSAVLVSDPAHGTLALSANGSFSYTPSLNYTGVDTFTYRATDGALTSAVATVAITITPLNDAPVAINDAYTIAEDTTLTINVPGILANDEDVDGDSLSAVIVSDVSHGTLVFSTAGSFSYTPSLNYTGADAFTYRATDGQATSALATVTIAVMPGNDPPVANNDAHTMAEDTTLIIDAPGTLTNDTDVDGDPLAAVLVSAVSHGTLNLSSNGAFVYTPSLNYTGLDTFTYRASDGASSSDIAIVTITITPVNDTPVANNDAYATAEDTALNIAAPGVLANDSDVDGDALSAVLVSNPAHGTLNLNASGAFVYTPSLNYTGLDTFTYRASDGQATSSIATVTISVASGNDAPVANNDAYATAEDAVLNIAAAGVLANDSDVDADLLSAVLVSDPTHGTLNLNADGAFSYTPSLNYTGFDTFTYRASDGQATSGVATVAITITPVNDTPIANNDAYSTAEDTALNIAAPGVLANDSDVDGDALSAVLVSDPTHGTLNLTSNGAFIYTPSLNYTGLDTFTYRASDGQATSAIATVTITITPVNDAPVALDEAYVTTEETALNIVVPGVLANDSDVDGDPLMAVLATNPMHGTVSLNTNGAFVYTPSLNYTGVDTFTYRASDRQALSAPATVTITITPANDTPVANNDAYAIAEDTTLMVASLGVLANDFDVDGDALNGVLISNPAHGTLSFNTNGAFTYTPSLNYTGLDTFTYRATDGSLTSDVATVTITIAPLNDPPVAGIGGDAYSVLEDNTLQVEAPGVLANDTDADGDPLNAVLLGGPSHGTLTLQANGGFVYVPAANYFGADSFTYAANDGQTNSSPAVVNLTVTPVNDAPSFVAGPSQRVNFNSSAQTIPNWATAISAGPANESAQTVYFVLSNDNPSLFSAQPSIGPGGALTYTPVGTAFGVATVTVALKDDGGTANGGADTSVQRTFTITLNGPPTVSIVHPINGSVYVGTNNITVIAEPIDPDSAITNVQIFLGTNLIGTFASAPCFVPLANVLPSTNPYSFRAIVVDDLGLRATSSVVSITVTQSPPVTALGPIALNRQNGLFEQYARIFNPTPYSFPNGVRLWIMNLDSTNTVYNASGTNAAGVPYIDVNAPLPAGSNVDVLVQYYVPNPRSVPSPTLMAEPLPYTIPSTPPPVLAPARRMDTGLLLQFATTTDRLYYLQASADLVHWNTLPGLVVGTGGIVQRTNSFTGTKFFRVLMLP